MALIVFKFTSTPITFMYDMDEIFNMSDMCACNKSNAKKNTKRIFEFVIFFPPKCNCKKRFAPQSGNDDVMVDIIFKDIE